MEQYIPKSALVAEIKDRICSYQEYIDGGYNYEDRKQELEDLLLSIDTLKVKEVNEVPATVMVNKYGNRFISS